MFSKSSVIMVLVAGILLLAAMGINALNGAPVNSLYLLLGVLLVAFSSAVLIFKKN
jgi:hypothetical protein